MALEPLPWKWMWLWMWLWTMAGLVLLSTLSCNESGKSERKSHENR